MIKKLQMKKRQKMNNRLEKIKPVIHLMVSFTQTTANFCSQMVKKLVGLIMVKELKLVQRTQMT
jgi:hypothetical protein